MAGIVVQSAPPVNENGFITNDNGQSSSERLTEFNEHKAAISPYPQRFNNRLQNHSSNIVEDKTSCHNQPEVTEEIGSLIESCSFKSTQPVSSCTLTNGCRNRYYSSDSSLQMSATPNYAKTQHSSSQITNQKLNNNGSFSTQMPIASQLEKPIGNGLVPVSENEHDFIQSKSGKLMSKQITTRK